MIQKFGENFSFLKIVSSGFIRDLKISKKNPIFPKILVQDKRDENLGQMRRNFAFPSSQYYDKILREISAFN